MKRFMVLVAVMVLLLAVSCDTLNIGGGAGPNRGPSNIVVTFPTVLGGEDGAITIAWAGGLGAVTMSADFGGGTTVNIAAGTAAGTSPYTQTFTFVNASIVDTATYNYTVTLTDSNAQSGQATGTFDVGPTPNQPPVIDSADFAAGVLTVNVSDPDPADTLTVTVTEPAGLAVDAASKAAVQVTGTATFNWSATDLLSGGTGDTSITVNDGTVDSAATVVAISMPGITIPNDTIWAMATASSAAVGAPVTIVVGTGDLANEFMYCNGVGVSVEEGGDYAAGSFNVGAIGGDPTAADGIWADMSPVPTAFASPQDWMMAWEAIAAEPGLGMMAFNVAPAIGGSGVTDGGILFNFDLEFDTAGTYNIGIVYMNIVRRTFYSDSAQAPWEWTDMDNDHAYNTITVT